MRILLFLIISFCIIPICAEALITSSGTSNGGIVCADTISYWETSDNLGDIDTTRPGYGYYSGGVRSRVTTNGRTYYSHDIDVSDSRTVNQHTIVETTKTGIVDEGGMVWSSQTNVSPMNCEYGTMVSLEGSDYVRYPETNSASARTGIIGTGEDTTYEAEYQIDNKLLGMSVAAHSESGLAWEEERGYIKAGFDVNETALQYIYKHRSRMVSIGTVNDTSKTADIVAQFVWDITADDIVGNETYDDSMIEASN